MARILIVEDEARIASFIAKGLTADGYTTATAADGHTGLDLALTGDFDLVILDIGLPGKDGYEVLEEMRASGSNLPVIVLTARDSVTDTVSALEGGADDYMPKPFSPAELVTRVKRLLERAGGGATSATTALLRHQALAVDSERYEASLDGVPIDLTHAEFRLLAALLAADGRVLTRDQLIDALRGVDGTVIDRTIDVHIGRLRQKLRDDPAAPRYIATVRGVGYRVPMSGSR